MSHRSWVRSPLGVGCVCIRHVCMRTTHASCKGSHTPTEPRQHSLRVKLLREWQRHCAMPISSGAPDICCARRADSLIGVHRAIVCRRASAAMSGRSGWNAWLACHDECRLLVTAIRAHLPIFVKGSYSSVVRAMVL